MSYSGSATNVSDGSQTITATFATESTNYNVPDARTAQLTITPAEIIVDSIKANDKTYSGNAAATLDYSTMSLAGKVGSDAVTATATGTFVDKNVGPGKIVTITDLALNGAAASNYVLAGSGQQTTATAAITAAEVTVSGITAADKAYDGATTATVNTAAATFAGMIPGDTLSVSTTGTFADADADTGKTVTFGTLTLGGADAGNYTVKGDSQTTTTATINKAEVTVSGIKANDKTYNGNTAATMDYSTMSLIGKVGSDDVTATATGTFDNKNVGLGKTVTISDLALGGTAAGNYVLAGSGQQTTATASITAAEVTVDDITAADKTYDGTTTATVNTASATFAGMIPGDTLSVSTTGTFADADADTGKTVTFGTLTLGGADAGNYTVKGDSQTTTTATINKAEVTVSGIKANDKTYNGNTAATMDYSTMSLAGKVGSDDVTATATGTFVDKNVGLGKTVTITDLALKGTAAGNYVLAGSGQQTTTAAAITAAEVTVNGITASNKTYDGNTSATVNTTAAIFTGKIAGDTLTVSTTGTFTDADANTGKTVTFGPLTLGGADADNYTVKGDSQTTTTATINKAEQPALTLSIAANVLVGNNITASTTGGAGDGAVTYTIAGGTGAGTFAGATFTASTEGTVNITATKAASTNYNATTSSAITVIIKNKMDAAASAIDASKITDGALKASLQNVGRYTVGTPVRVSDNVNEFTIAIVGTSALTAYDDGTSDEGQWVGVILSGVSINGGASLGTTSIFLSTDGGSSYTQLAAADLTKVQDLGGVDGDFVFWMKAEDIGAGKDLYIATDASGTNATKITFTYVPKSGGKPAPPVTPPVTEPPVTSGGTTTSTITVTPQTTGSTSTAGVPAGTFNNAAGAAAQQAEETGTQTNVTLNVGTPPQATRLELSLPTASVRALVAQDENASLTVASGIATITFDGAALAAVGGSAAGPEIIIVAEDLPRHSLTQEQQALVGDRPVIDLYVMSGGKRITDFKGGTATITIPYELREGETPEGIVVWYLAEGGKLIEKKCVYDPVAKTVTFVADHFSEYVIAHFPFTDMRDSQWYYENVVFAYTHGLMNGTQPTLFSPESNITRGMVVTILWRMAGEPASGAHGFKDVKYDWYDQAIAWAYANGIVTGYSADRFGPENQITREELAKILRSYAAYKGQVPTDRVLLSSYSDAAAVSDWALPSMEWAVAKGIISGTNRNTLEPGSPALRAQVAAIMQRFMSGR